MKYCTLVTGATGGIGREVANLLEAEGRTVLRLGHEIDLANPEALGEVESFIKSGYDGVDGFVHCAGFDAPAPLGMIDPLIADDLYRVHVLFPMLFLGWMGKKRSHGEGASAVLVSSRAAHEVSKGHVAYAAAKGALESMALSASAELEAQGVRLSIVSLGPVDTKMTRKWRDKLPEAMRPPVMSPLAAAEKIVEEFNKGAITWTVPKQ